MERTHFSFLLLNPVTRWLLSNLIELPARLLYLYGPCFNSGTYTIGFWEGKIASQICAELTGTKQSFWEASAAAMLECNELIDRKFGAFLVLIYAVIYAGAFAWILVTCSGCAKSAINNLLKTRT